MQHFEGSSQNTFIYTRCTVSVVARLAVTTNNDDNDDDMGQQTR